MSFNMEFARGYIASGEFNRCRAPQHIQNQIIKSYCDANNLKFVLSRAEYWINGSTNCQLWAGLNEGFKHIVFYSVWQLSELEGDRNSVYRHCINNEITLHFAVERINAKCTKKTFSELEILIKSNLLISNHIDYENHFRTLREITELSVNST